MLIEGEVYICVGAGEAWQIAVCFTQFLCELEKNIKSIKIIKSIKNCSKKYKIYFKKKKREWTERILRKKIKSSEVYLLYS